MKVFLSLPGLFIFLAGGTLIFWPSAPTLQIVFGAILSMVGAVIMYYAIFSED